MLLQRILTALVLIPVVVAILLWMPQQSFQVLTALIVLGAAWEWTAFLKLSKRWHRLAYLWLVAVCIVVSRQIPIDFILAPTFAWWLIATVLVILYPAHGKNLLKNPWVRGVMGLLVLVPCWTAINDIRIQEDGTYILLFLFVIIWGADSAAYFVGRKFGKHKLAPCVSPGKSVEGLIGALITTIIITLFALWLVNTPGIIWPWAIAVALITVSFSVVGDLFESMMKRETNLKDSGQILPGHGGLLDRLDSLTAGAPVFAFCGWFIHHYLF